MTAAYLKTSLVCFLNKIILTFNQYSFIFIVLSLINKFFLSVSKREFRYKEQRLILLCALNATRIKELNTPQQVRNFSLSASLHLIEIRI